MIEWERGLFGIVRLTAEVFGVYFGVRWGYIQIKKKHFKGFIAKINAIDSFKYWGVKTNDLPFLIAGTTAELI